VAAGECIAELLLTTPSTVLGEIISVAAAAAAIPDAAAVCSCKAAALSFSLSRSSPAFTRSSLDNVIVIDERARPASALLLFVVE
jgi:hypothetical protein